MLSSPENGSTRSLQSPLSAQLNRFFNPLTGDLKPGAAAGPLTPAWEKEMKTNIRDGKGLSARVDRVIDAIVGWAMDRLDEPVEHTKTYNGEGGNGRVVELEGVGIGEVGGRIVDRRQKRGKRW